MIEEEINLLKDITYDLRYIAKKMSVLSVPKAELAKLDFLVDLLRDTIIKNIQQLINNK